jgi:general secretion pathway protein E
LGACVRLAQSWDVGLIWDQVDLQFALAFASPAWKLLLQIGVGALALSIVLRIVEVLAGIRRRARAPEFGELEKGSSVRDSLAVVRERIERCAKGKRGAPHVIALVEETLRGALALNASDIHFSPTPQALKITFRIQGTLYEAVELDPLTSPLVATRIKVMCGMGTHIRTKPQDGRLATTVGGVQIEARVSTLPTEAGERIVLRILRGGLPVPDLDELGCSPAVLAGVRELLLRPQGLFFLSGPVGSGKTTSLYAFLRYIGETRGKTTTLVTLEDPVELELPFATQTQINTRGGVSFAEALRSILRQDPNVLMLGEIRDHETAEIAIQAGLTGHLLLTTVHSDTAAAAMTRLLEMEVQTFALASAAVGSMSQRLVRGLCQQCRRPCEASEGAITHFGSVGISLPQGKVFFEAVGCAHCSDEGYEGRKLISELMIVDAAVRRAIQDKRSSAEIAQIAYTAGTIPLVRDGLDRALAGETSLDEVLRVTR